jgi:hypothetical protein
MEMNMITHGRISNCWKLRARAHTHTHDNGLFQFPGVGYSYVKVDYFKWPQNTLSYSIKKFI